MIKMMFPFKNISDVYTNNLDTVFRVLHNLILDYKYYSGKYHNVVINTFYSRIEFHAKLTNLNDFNDLKINIERAFSECCYQTLLE